ncbi:MAG: hypothetical protein IT437_11495 [Phycisphaerales bacterium]|nr:hypothetical protein [Phycisphaerales bacterium]
MKGKPHVSEALAQLRHGVTVASLLVCAAAVAQVLVFGFVHFTTIRWNEVEPPVHEQPLSIVESAQPAKPDIVVAAAPGATRVEPPPRIEGLAETGTAAASRPGTAVPKAADGPALELAHADTVLRRVTEVTTMVGSASTVALCLLVMLGVAVAGGGGFPGVQRAVSAASWSILLAMACLPWKEMVPTTMFHGVFSSYDVLLDASAGVDRGGSLAGLLANFLVLPMGALLMSLLILARFRAGVADGIIITSVNELDAALDREMASISKRGVRMTGARAVGALNQAIGSATEAPPPPAEEDHQDPQPEPPRPRRLSQRELEGFKRPI